jgi:hypothetical protein
MEDFRLASVAEQFSTLYESVVARNAYETTTAPLTSRAEAIPTAASRTG